MIIAPPTGPDVSLAAHYVIPVVIMGLLSLFLCSCRIYTRCRPKFNLKLDDYLILAAQVKYSRYCDTREHFANISSFARFLESFVQLLLCQMDGDDKVIMFRPRK